MADLTFAEQVKIILKRKGMTIKALADLIEEKTGKKMSRQNLTQKLGRDNFQERDMKLIASILGCEYKMDILGDNNVEESPNKIGHGLAIEIEDVVKEESSREITVGELVDIVEDIKKVEEPQVNEEVYEEETPVAKSAPVREEEATQAEVVEEPEVVEEVVAEEVVPEESEYEPEVEEIEETPEASDEVYEEAYEEPEDIYTEETSDEVEEPVEDNKLTHEEIEQLLKEEKEAEEAAKKEAQKEQKPKGGIFSVFSRFKGKSTKPTDVKGVEELVVEEEEPEQAEPEEEVAASEPEAYYEETYEEPDEATEIEEMYHEEEPEEELIIEEPKINPYTGREYESNSVRMHPSKIGYVQIYSRKTHSWVEITEWAFLGYQERQKVLLGKDYKEPTYLD